jgi:hypothetical protein
MFIIKQSDPTGYDHRMGLSATELALAIGVLLIIAVIATGALVTRRRTGRTTLITTPTTPHHLEQHLRNLIHQNKKIHAIKLLREHTGMGLKDAKDAVDRMALGHPLSGPPGAPRLTARPAPPQDDLATRVRHLKQQDRTEQAIFLVRGETGMNEAEATLFVNSL